MSSETSTCHLCGKSIPTAEYDAHVDTCAADKIQCPMCFGQFDKDSIERHAAMCDGTAPSAGAGGSRGGGFSGGSGVGRGYDPGAGVRGATDRSTSGGGPLCKGGCGFNGNEALGGYCSKCIYKVDDISGSGGGGGAVHRGESKYVPGEIPSVKATYNAGNGRTIVICKGDLTLEDADAIVNPANKKLDHASGVAGAIRRMGGTIIQDSSDIYTHEKGDVPTGSAITGPSGDLKCKHLIHAVGPIWDKEDYEMQKICKDQLASAVNSSMIQAEQNECTSIAIPAISSGIFGFPRVLCAQILFAAVSHYWSENHNSLIRQVRFTNIDNETVEVFLKMFPKTETALARTLSSGKVLRCVRGDQSHYFFGAHLESRIIVDATSVRNPTVHHAGHDLIQESLNKSLDAQLNAAKIRGRYPKVEDAMEPLSSFMIMSPHVLVATIPMFDVTEDSVKGLRAAIQRVLFRASSALPEVKEGQPGGTIALPAIGSKTGFSQTMASQIVLEEVLKFLASNGADNIREVMFCEDNFSQFFVDHVRAAVDANGDVQALPAVKLPNLEKPATPPPDETPAQRRERERAMAQARLTMELANQGPVFE